MAIYAIGDIQGCFNELKQLLEKIRFKPDCDQLWLTGDLVNRGPHSLQTLEFLYALSDNLVTVLGNHDLHLLATAYDHKKPGKKDTLHELLESPRSHTLLEWLRMQPLFHHDETLNVSMVHAGLHPDWSIENTASLAHEVEAILRSDQHIDYYRHMYGDKPARWSDDLSGWQRYRFITNMLTRIRYFDRDGNAVLQAKGAPDSANSRLVPWFDMPQRVSREHPVIFGHWSTLTLIQRDYPNVYPIDTGCLWGGKLTALRIDEQPYTAITIHCAAAQKPESFTQVE